ncbi:MAG TPA: protein phosphatase 2C domain-containing protein [Bryobacteraceae bacterium]|nr:protein phosphatase 2C domain-containing protein [Bryobacteraceae bacterium]
MGNRAARFAGGSDMGLVRTNNEDAWHADLERGVFLVVDGIGGQAAGEKAAEIAVARVRARLERQTGTAEQRIREAITMANNEILRAAESQPEWRGMACVLTVAVVEDGCAVVGHVGDSRLYRVRRGEIRKITHDHSPVGEREDRGELSEFEAMRHPRRNEVFRDVGSEERSPDDPDFIEIERVPFAPDSALVLCSDGLSDQVPANRIRAAVEGHAGHPEEAVRQLIEEANAEGGKDNVTVVVVEGETFGQAPAPRVRRLAGRAAMFVYGAALAAAAASALYWFTRPAPVKPPHLPAVLMAGQGAKFPAIAEAMDAAQPGDTVEALGGEFSEQVRLKSGVTLRSRVPHEAVLRAAPLGRGPAVIAENVSGARFSGFRIVADTHKPLATGIELVNSDAEVSDVEVQGAGVGIGIRGTGEVSLVGNTIQDCLAEGVLIAGTSAPWISHNLIRRNKGAAIAAREGARPVLDGNMFERGTLELPPELRPGPAAAPRKKP